MRTRACFFVALRYLLGRAREGGRYLRGATAGIAISLVPIIVTLIVADGMIQGILGRFLELSSGHMQVFVPSGRSPEDAAEKIREVRGVTGAWPELRGMAVLVGPGGRAGTSVRAVDPEFWREEGSLRYLQLVSGSLEFEGNRDMLLGRSLAAAIGAEPGDTVRMMTINTASGETAVPRVTAFTLRGIVSSGYHELDALWCVIGEEGGRGLVGLDRNSSSILVKVADPYRERELDGMFWKLRDALGDGFRIHGWQELLGGQYDSYRSTRQMLLFIMALIVMVAAVNVSSATSMLALERFRDIAVLKVTGAGAFGITGIFLWGSLLTGICGAALGIAFGLLIGSFINPLIHSLEAVLGFFTGGEVRILDPDFYLASIPIVIDFRLILLIGCFTVLCSVLASILPAARAGRRKPMELLRRH